MDFTTVLLPWHLKKTERPDVYQFEAGKETISVSIEGFANRRSDRPFLVGFSGAISGRQEKKPPFLRVLKLRKA